MKLFLLKFRSSLNLILILCLCSVWEKSYLVFCYFQRTNFIARRWLCKFRKLMKGMQLSSSVSWFLSLWLFVVSSANWNFTRSDHSWRFLLLTVATLILFVSDESLDKEAGMAMSEGCSFHTKQPIGWSVLALICFWCSNGLHDDVIDYGNEWFYFVDRFWSWSWCWSAFPPVEFKMGWTTHELYRVAPGTDSSVCENPSRSSYSEQSLQITALSTLAGLCVQQEHGTAVNLLCFFLTNNSREALASKFWLPEVNPVGQRTLKTRLRANSLIRKQFNECGQEWLQFCH